MINLILQLVGFASLANLVTDFLMNIDTNDRIPQKPFKCDMCMAYWISVIPFIYQFGLVGLLYAAISSTIAQIIFKITV